MKEFLLCFILMSVFSTAQLRFATSASSELRPTTCWNVRIDGLRLGDRIVLRAKISDEQGRPLVELQSEERTVLQVPQVMRAEELRSKSVTWLDEDMKNMVSRNGTFPYGKYLFCTKCYAVVSGELLSEDCALMQSLPASGLSGDATAQNRGGGVEQTGSSSSIVRGSGKASAEYVYSPRQSAEYQLPPSLLRLQFQPSFDVYRVPVFANVYYTSEISSRYPNQFAFSFGFDAQRFRDNMRLLAEQEMRKRLGFDAKDYEAKRAEVDSMGSIGTRLRSLQLDTAGLAALERDAQSNDEAEQRREQQRYDSTIRVALEAIKYDSLRSHYSSMEQEVLDIHPVDSTETARCHQLMDTIQSRIDVLEQRKDSILKNTPAIQQRRSLLETARRAAEATSTKLQELKYKREEIGRLQEKKEYLLGLKHVVEQYPESLAQMQASLRDPEQIRRVLKESAQFSGTDKVLFNTQLLTIGTVYPSWSAVTLSGLQVQGVAADLSLGPLLVGLVGGNTNLGAIDYLSPHQSLYPRWMIAGRAGFGNRDGSYFMLSYLNVFDTSSTVAYSEAREVFPMKTTILGSELQWLIANDLIRLRAELALSMFNRNLRDSVTGLSEDIEQYIPRFLRPNVSTSYDYAATVTADMQLLPLNELTLYREYVGPGYYSFGAPFLRNDVSRYGARIEQGFFDNVLRVGCTYRSESDNLIATKRSSSESQRFGVRATVSIPLLPSIRAEVYRSTLNTGGVDSRLSELMLSSSYAYTLFSTRWRTSIDLRQQTNTADSIDVSSYNLSTLNLRQTISLAAPVMLLVNATLNAMSINGQVSSQSAFGAGLQINVLRSLTITAQSEFASTGVEADRKGVELGVRFSACNALQLSLQSKYFVYSSSVASALRTEDFSLQSMLSYAW